MKLVPQGGSCLDFAREDEIYVHGALSATSQVAAVDLSHAEHSKVDFKAEQFLFQNHTEVQVPPLKHAPKYVQLL